MTLLILGLVLWSAGHFWKRALPGPHATLGSRAKGLSTVVILAGVVLMVLGYRSAAFVDVWFPPAWTVHLNNLVMLFAVAMFGMGSSKGKARSWLRHPMLMGTLVFALSHVLVNGDLASIVLFGGLSLWAVAQMVVINATSPAWVRPAPGPIKGDVKLVVISLVLFTVITFVHGWIGPSPFGA